MPRETPLNSLPGVGNENIQQKFVKMISPVSSGELGSSGRNIKLQADAWMPDKDVHNCCKCSRKFSVWVRKHHCRLCNRIFCKKCSFTKMRKHDGDVLKIRACVDCDKI